MQIFSAHFMPWGHLPPDFEGSAWITCSNGMFDPEIGHQLYSRYLDELVLAEQLGFDGVMVNEHHQNAYGLMPSPNLFAAMLSQRTSTCKIAVIGNALPLYNPPTRVAEEYAVLDVVSGGRLITGMVIGGGPEYYSYGINPTQARRRFSEALDLIIRAWTEPGPFEFDGEFYKLRYVNPWPRPLQQPHPPVWVPGLGSVETMDLVASRGFGYTGLPFFHSSVSVRNYGLFRKKWLEAGRAPDPSKLGSMLPIYVAETDRKAREEYEEHFFYFSKNLLNGIELTPPGYTTAESALRIRQAHHSFALSLNSWDEVEAGNYAFVGSPDTVADKLCEHLSKLGAANLLGLFQLGTLPHELTTANLTLFADEVAPVLRKELGDGPTWADAA